MRRVLFSRDFPKPLSDLEMVSVISKMYCMINYGNLVYVSRIEQLYYQNEKYRAVLECPVMVRHDDTWTIAGVVCVGELLFSNPVNMVYATPRKTILKRIDRALRYCTGQPSE